MPDEHHVEHILINPIYAISIAPDLGPIPEGLCRPALNLLIGRPRAIRSGGL